MTLRTSLTAPSSMTAQSPMTLVNARFGAASRARRAAQRRGGQIGSLRIADSRISGVNVDPRPGDLILDLQGDRVLPGFINAHDHLQLNSLPRPQPQRAYGHVREWIADVDASRRADANFEAQVAVDRNERLLIGGVKNLLSGVTTVAHHDPLYEFLAGAEFPTAVVRDYGWAHSLYAEGDAQVFSSYRATPAGWPWVIHAAEGVDEEAAGEFERLEALGCLQSNTLLVHGIALDPEQRSRLKRAGAGLVWCPVSNMSLFGRTAQIADLLGAGCVALGTDSRLSGARDLLEELRAAAQLLPLDEAALEVLVTRRSARLLRLADRGSLEVGMRADLVVLPAAARLGVASRADVRLVMIEGSVRYGDRDIVESLGQESQWTRVRVDGKVKVLDGRIAAQLAGSSAAEPGLELPSLAWRAA